MTNICCTYGGVIIRPQTRMSAARHQGTPAATMIENMPYVATVLQSTIRFIAVIRCVCVEQNKAPK